MEVEDEDINSKSGEQEQKGNSKNKEGHHRDKWIIAVLFLFFLLFSSLSVYYLCFYRNNPRPGPVPGNPISLEEALDYLKNDIKPHYDEGFNVRGYSIHEVVETNDASRTIDVGDPSDLSTVSVTQIEDGVATRYTFDVRSGETYRYINGGDETKITAEEANSYLNMAYEDYEVYSSVDLDNDIELIGKWVDHPDTVDSYLAYQANVPGSLYISVNGSNLDGNGMKELTINYSNYLLTEWSSYYKDYYQIYHFSLSETLT